LAVDTDINC